LQGVHGFGSSAVTRARGMNGQRLQEVASRAEGRTGATGQEVLEKGGVL